jgi:hypothetical protein
MRRAERCRSGRTGQTRNLLSLLRGTVGSNPTLSARVLEAHGLRPPACPVRCCIKPYRRARMIWTAARLLSSHRPLSPVVARRLQIVKELPDAKQSGNNATLRPVNCESKQPPRRLSSGRDGSISEAAPRAGGTRGKASRRERRRSVNHPSGPAGEPAIPPALDLYNRTEPGGLCRPIRARYPLHLRVDLRRTVGQGTPRDGRHRPFG